MPTPALYDACERRHIPRELLILLSKLINVDPNLRPTAEKVRSTLKGLVSRLPLMIYRIGTDNIGESSSIRLRHGFVH
jgi:hypothetical protein